MDAAVTLLILTGPPAAGKNTIAAAFARQLAEAWS